MTTTTERTFQRGQQFRLLPAPTTVGGGGVYLGTATLVEVTQAAQDDRGNVSVRAVDGSVRGTTQWVDPGFLAPLTPATYDWTDLDAAFDRFIRGGNIPKPDGGTLSSPTDWKREDMFTALHAMASEHRDGTLGEFASYNAAGQTFWARVHAMPARGTRWQYNYGEFAPSAVAIGGFLESNRGLIESAPALAGAQPLSGYVRPERLTEGMLVAYEGQIAKVSSVSRDGTNIDLQTWSTDGGRRTRTMPSSDIHYVIEQGVTKLRRNSRSTIYTPVIPEGEIVTFNREWGGVDHAIYINREDGTVTFDARWGYDVVMPEPAAVPDRSTVEQPKVATITHDGEEYVRLADVLADHALAAEILHKGADENGLCTVYDKVGRQVDEATLLFKMGQRPRRRRMKGTFTVEVAYDFLTDAPFRTDEDAVAAVTEQIEAHIPVPTQAPNPGNTYYWRVTGPTINNTFNEVI